jgi:hypothetical protein
MSKKYLAMAFEPTDCSTHYHLCETLGEARSVFSSGFRNQIVLRVEEVAESEDTPRVCAACGKEIIGDHAYDSRGAVHEGDCPE